MLLPEVYNTCLSKNLILGKNARVMLTKNLNDIDGLVGGTCGTVTDIIKSNNTTFPQSVQFAKLAVNTDAKVHMYQHTQTHPQLSNYKMKSK